MCCFSSGLTKAPAVFNKLFAGNRRFKCKPLLIEIEQSWPRSVSNLVKVAYTAISMAIFRLSC